MICAENKRQKRDLTAGIGLDHHVVLPDLEQSSDQRDRLPRETADLILVNARVGNVSIFHLILLGLGLHYMALVSWGF